MQVRAARGEDAAAVLRLQAECHCAALHESAACVRAIIAAQCSFLALDGAGDAVGYALAHDGEQAAFDATPPVCASAAGSSASCDSFFLHDVAVRGAARGAGVARALVRAALACGAERGAAHAHLVALPGTAALWLRFGFAACEDGAYDDAASYGPGAVHMRATLSDTHRL